MSATPGCGIDSHIKRSKQIDSIVERFAENGPGRSVSVLEISHPITQQEPATWGRHADCSRPAASTLKLLVAIAVIRRPKGATPSLSDKIALADIPQSEHRALIDVLDRSTHLSVGEICGLCIASSDNALAQYMISILPEGHLAAVTASLGCTGSYLAVGYSDEALDASARNNRTTANDMVRLVREIVTSPDLGLIATAMGRSIQGTRIPMRLRPMFETGHKTGSLTGVCNDVGFVTDGKSSMAMAFLCEDEDDNAITSLEIGDCARDIWLTWIGERG